MGGFEFYVLPELWRVVALPILLTSNRPKPLLSCAAGRCSPYQLAPGSTKHAHELAHQGDCHVETPKEPKTICWRVSQPIYRWSKAENLQIDKFTNLFAMYDIDLDGEDDPFSVVGHRVR